VLKVLPSGIFVEVHQIGPFVMLLSDFCFWDNSWGFDPCDSSELFDVVRLSFCQLFVTEATSWYWDGCCQPFVAEAASFDSLMWNRWWACSGSNRLCLRFLCDRRWLLLDVLCLRQLVQCCPSVIWSNFEVIHQNVCVWVGWH
jgi:hypothetical protein